ncbi:MAG: adenylate kinase [Crocosphaera sp.]|nr:adenylate kinase [Crocosphaera sp.]
MRLIFLGPPGAGKGTQAKVLANQWQVPHISTGDILREAIQGKTSLGIQAATYVEAGELVPDLLIMAIMRERFGREDVEKGWILDGFPRTLAQANALDQLLQIMRQPYGKVVYFDVSSDVLVKRLLQRGRVDDTQETIGRRLEIYQEQTTPLIDFYQRRHCLKTIDGNLPISQINQKLEALFSALV